MAVLSKGGTGPAARTATEVAQPTASDRGTGTEASGPHAARTRALASSKGITGPPLRLPRPAAAAQEVVQEPAQFRAQVGPLQCQLHRGPQVVELVARVVTAPLEDLAVDPFLEEQTDGVGELDLAPPSRLHPLQGPEDGGGEHVAPDDGQVGGRLLRRRLLHDVQDLHHARLD